MKLLHTADIHIGVDAHGRLDASTGLNTRMLDFQNAFEFMVDYALKADIDAFLFAGDAYRTADPTPTQQRLFAECLKPIADAGIPILGTSPEALDEALPDLLRHRLARALLPSGRLTSNRWRHGGAMRRTTPANEEMKSIRLRSSMHTGQCAVRKPPETG